MRFRVVFLLGLALIVAGCGRPSAERRYRLHGQVLSVEPERKTVTIKHEEIQGFMPAMTMPYEVQESGALAGLAPGDLINASLVVFSNGAYLTDLQKVGTAPLEPAPAEAFSGSGRPHTTLQ
jgi:Cu/Ag efflux protein CusF